MKAVATHSIDDTTPTVATALEVIDRCGIKATIFVNTAREPIDKLWPRLRQAIADGHEIGAHGRTHPCAWPPNDKFCREYYTNDQVVGSRDDILKNTPQPYVWSWAYPCGHCVELPGIQQIIQRAGYLVARNYPDALKDEHLVPNLQTWALNRYDAGYTQVAQKQAGHAKSGLTDVARLNAKFDEVYRNGGIYHVMSHPNWLDYGPDKFYEAHLRYVGHGSDVWYIPMGPLYAHHILSEKIHVREIGKTRFAVSNDLDPRIYNGSITLKFGAPADVRVVVGGKELNEFRSEVTDRWNSQYVRREKDVLLVTVAPNAIIEFR
jgi:peptidoglycan/xylan/chitin deacetylase (PgdA/CDA1 family)